MASAFDSATRVDLLGGDEAGHWRFSGEIRDGWDIGGVANGGYVLALAARAMEQAVGRPPLSITAHYLAPGRPGPVVIGVDAARVGGRLATLSADLTQGDRVLIRVLGTFGTRAGDSVQLTLAPPRDLPAFDSPSLVPRRGSPLATPSGLPDRLDVRLRPGDDGFATGSPSGRAEIAGWFAFADQRPEEALDALAVLLAADAFAPPIFNSRLVEPNWVPTIELTVHVRGRPAPGPLMARFRSDVVAGGLLGEDGELWDVDGRLVAQSRQLALLPRPADHGPA
jgi:acyl-CoA thioesterase